MKSKINYENIHLALVSNAIRIKLSHKEEDNFKLTFDNMFNMFSVFYRRYENVKGLSSDGDRSELNYIADNMSAANYNLVANYMIDNIDNFIGILNYDYWEFKLIRQFGLFALVQMHPKSFEFHLDVK